MHHRMEETQLDGVFLSCDRGFSGMGQNVFCRLMEYSLSFFLYKTDFR